MKATLVLDIEDTISDKIRSQLMPLFEDLKAEIQVLKDSAATEHDQVLAVLDALNSRVVNSITDAEKGEIVSLFAEARAAIGGVYEPPPAEEPPPAPEPLPDVVAPTEGV